jgi:hypothetical protein
VARSTREHLGRAWYRHEDRQAGQELHRRHHPVGLASARRLQVIRHAPILHPLDALEREGRARAISDEAFPSLVVASFDAHRAVHVEAVARRRKAWLIAVQVLVGALLGNKGSADERATPEREAREGVDECLRGRLVAAVLRGALVEVAVQAQPGEGAIVHAPGDITRRATSATSAFAGGGASWMHTPSPCLSKTAPTAKTWKCTCKLRLPPNL